MISCDYNNLFSLSLSTYSVCDEKVKMYFNRIYFVLASRNLQDDIKILEIIAKIVPEIFDGRFSEIIVFVGT